MKDLKSLFFKLKFCKNKLTLDKSNKYALDMINNPNATLEDLIKFSNLVTFDKEIIFKKLLELNNVSLIVGYLDFLISSEDRDFINLKHFKELFEIYLKNTNKDITNFILSNYPYMNLELLLFIFDYYFQKDSLIINRFLCDKSVLLKLIDYIDSDKIDYVKKYVLELIQDSEYNTAERILNILLSKKIVNSDYVKKFEECIADKSSKNSISRKFAIGYYKKNIDNEDFRNRSNYILNSIAKSSTNEDIYSIVKFLISRGDIDNANYISEFVTISDNEREIINYNKLLKLPIPIAVILEKDIYLDKKLVLNIIKKDKLRLYVYGQEIIDGYNFDDHDKNIFLDNKYIDLLKRNNMDYQEDEGITSEFNRINTALLKINRYNKNFQKYV